MGYHCEPNLKFNGVVHFRYSGSELPAEEVREKLVNGMRSINPTFQQGC